MQSPWEEGRRCGKGEPWMMSPLLLSLWLPCRYSARGPGSLVQCECAFLRHTCISGYTRKRYLVPVGYYVLLCLWYLANLLCWKKIMKVYKGPICNWQECFPIFLWHFWNLKKKNSIMKSFNTPGMPVDLIFYNICLNAKHLPKWTSRFLPDRFPHTSLWVQVRAAGKAGLQRQPCDWLSFTTCMTTVTTQHTWNPGGNLARASSFSQKYPVLSTYNIIRLQRVCFWPISSAPK